MQIKAEEISKIIRDQIGNYAVDVDVAEVGTVMSVGDGIARMHGVERAMAGEMLEFPNGLFGIALNLEEESVGAVLLGRSTDDQGRRHGQAHGPHHLGAGRRRDARPRRERARPADRRQGPDRVEEVHADRAPGARRRRSLAGQGAAADRPQGDRRHGADRPRPARADHRRPADRQDRGRRRRDHQSEGPRRHLHLQRDRPEAVDGRAGREDARRRRRDGLHHRRRRRRVRSRAAALHQPVFGVHDRRVSSATAAATRCASTTTCRSTRRRIARFRCCCGARRAARRIPATSSICTRACSSARRSSRRSWAADR